MGMGMVRRGFAAAILAALLIGAAGWPGYDQALTLRISQTIEPERVFIQDSGVSPQQATVTLTLEAPGQVERLIADVILVVDRSADSQLGQIKAAAERIIDLLGPNDRVGLVSFATEATLDARLTPVAEADGVRAALARLVAEGKTALGEGIAVAADELAFAGRPEAAWIQILLTDGRNNFGRSLLEAAQTAAERNVTIYAIGMGRFVNRALLTEIANITGGQFFPAFNDAIIDQILRITIPPDEPVVTDIEIFVTLTDKIHFKEALENPPSLSPDKKTLSWRLPQLMPDEIWTASFTVGGSAVDECTVLNVHRTPSYVSFRDFRGRETQRDLPQLALEVCPPPPPVRCAFSFSPVSPTIFDEVEFTDESSVKEGEIIGWLWDFGDGTTSTERNPKHRYDADGEYLITLTVRSDKGATDSCRKKLTVFTPKVTAIRTIDTFIPPDETIPGQTIRVTIEIRVNAKIHGLGLDEDIPSGWEFNGVEDGSAQFRKEDLQWIFNEVLEPGMRKTIIYEVKIPEEEEANTYWIDGKIISALPKFKRDVEGDRQIEVLTGFPIRVVVAHWDVAKNELDLRAFPTHIIDDRQIEKAREWWREGIEVPYTEDEDGKRKVIDLEMMQELEAYWLTGTSVFEPLPQEEE